MQNENLIIFERRSGLFLNPLKIAGTVLVFILGILSMGDEFHLVMLVLPVLLVVILPGLAKKSLKSVVLDPSNGDGVIVLNRWGRVYKRVIIPIKDLNVSYKDELSMKAIKRKILRLFHKKLLIVVVFSGDGWTDESLEEMAAAINELKGIKSNKK